MGLIILYFLGALSLSFLCSVLEAVLLSTPMSFISMKENQGSKTASLMKQYKNNVDRPVKVQHQYQHFPVLYLLCSVILFSYFPLHQLQ